MSPGEGKRSPSPPRVRVHRSGSVEVLFSGHEVSMGAASTLDHPSHHHSGGAAGKSEDASLYLAQSPTGLLSPQHHASSHEAPELRLQRARQRYEGVHVLC